MTEQQQQDIFNQWLAQHKAILFKVVRAYAATPMDRDDLFQEISIQVWFSVPSFRNEASVATWLYRIAFNTAIKWALKARKHVAAATPEFLEPVLQQKPAENDDRLDWLYAEIHKLDPIDRSLTLLMLDNYSYREMAAMLGITESNVGVKINRIKKQLINKSKNYDRHGV